MSTLKFLHEQNEKNHGSRLHWGSLVGTEFAFPFRGRTEMLRKEELDKVQTVTDFCFKNFDLEDPDDIKQYRDVMDRVASGWYTVYRKIPWVNPHNGQVKMYVEWGQRYNELVRREDALS